LVQCTDRFQAHYLSAKNIAEMSNRRRVLPVNPTMRTERLELQPPTIGDARALFDAYATDSQVTKYLPWHPATRLAEMQAHLATRIMAAAAGESFSWTIRKLDEPAPVGMIELRVDGRDGNVGYVLARSHWGQGIVPEALAAVVEFARNQLSLRRIWGICDIENHASVRVFEKCGFRYLGVRPALVVHPAVSERPRDAHYFEIDLSQPNAGLS
jgi:[ribosomal protein S5]-alanine N-acetyltransferase